MLNPDQLQTLAAAARAAAQRAYAPYSRFRVGAALLTSDGTLHTGCNVENVSYGLTSCAERNAIFAAVNAGVRTAAELRASGGVAPHLVACVVYTPTPTPTSPCGACRQVLAEFNPALELWFTCDGATSGPHQMTELLPLAFDEAQLNS